MSHSDLLAIVPLSTLSKGSRARVVGVTAVETLVDPERAPLLRRLVELGFVPGELLEIVAEARPGRDPIAVRVGTTTFALRRFEASFISVRRELI